ncbi:hypothetical protein [Methylobacterium sp. Leaf118]|uniref:hypothetical protein n=1 Tax=Methylobacterium sp. Leaf118 TaxID=2876562 RepID=UPI001E343DB9|nr:hypothetical protein [Methylobacterium sp. Leaf118]
MAGLIATSRVDAAECPIGPERDAIVQRIGQASGCLEASRWAQDCAMGASGDVSLAAAVTEVCERDFRAGLDRWGRAAYDRQRAACRRQYRHADGSMSRSFEAFCEARVSERFARAAEARRRR